jgi:hypothetical protein
VFSTVRCAVAEPPEPALPEESLSPVLAQPLSTRAAAAPATRRGDGRMASRRIVLLRVMGSLPVGIVA